MERKQRVERMKAIFQEARHEAPEHAKKRVEEEREQEEDDTWESRLAFVQAQTMEPQQQQQQRSAASNRSSQHPATDAQHQRFQEEEEWQLSLKDFTLEMKQYQEMEQECLDLFEKAGLLPPFSPPQRRLPLTAIPCGQRMKATLTELDYVCKLRQAGNEMVENAKKLAEEEQQQAQQKQPNLIVIGNNDKENNGGISISPTRDSADGEDTLQAQLALVQAQVQALLYSDDAGKGGRRRRDQKATDSAYIQSLFEQLAAAIGDYDFDLATEHLQQLKRAYAARNGDVSPDAPVR